MALIVIILTNLMIIQQSIFAQEQESEPEYKPVNLFMYGNADRGDLLTEAPTSTTDTKADCPVSGATPGVMMLVGQWYTKSLNNPLTIHGKYSFELWADGTGNNVEFDVQLHHNGEEVTRCFSERQNVNGPTLFRGEIDVNLDANAGDTIEIWIYFSYYDTRNVEILYGSIEHNSHITIISNPISIIEIETNVEEKKGIITGTFTEAFGSDLTRLNYTISIIGPTEAKTISKPITTQGVGNETNATNISIVQWTWDFKQDEAAAGEYIITITVGYEMNTTTTGTSEANMWTEEANFVLTKEQIKDEKDDENNWFIPVIVIIVGVAVVSSVIIYKRKH